MPVRFEYSSLLAASVEEAYRFHENPENMRLITPASLRILRIACHPAARVGETFRVEASRFGVPIRWTGRWDVVEPGRRLVDSAPESPFAYWRHEHLFSPEDGRCRLTDRLEFQLRGGAVGHLVSRFLPLLVFRPMFRERHAATRDWFKRARATPE